MTLQDKINKEPYFKAKNLTDIADVEYSLQELKKLIAEYGYTKQLIAILTRINNKKSKLSGTMKLTKGSKAAKDFMAKIRSMKNKPKKSKVGAIKRSTRKVVKNNTSVLSGTHKDTKSHNYKISISGDTRKKLSADAVSSMRSIAKAIQIIYKRNAWGDSELNNRQNIAQAYTMLWELILSNGYTITQSGKLTKAIH